MLQQSQRFGLRVAPLEGEELFADPLLGGSSGVN